MRYPVRIILDGVHFPIKGLSASASLSLGPDVYSHPAHINEHTRVLPNIYCGRKRCPSRPCACGNCLAGLCAPPGCSCGACVALEHSIHSDLLAPNDAVKAFALQCHKIIEQSAFEKHSNGRSSDIIDSADESPTSFSKARALLSPDMRLCCLSGQVFKHHPSVTSNKTTSSSASSSSGFSFGQNPAPVPWFNAPSPQFGMGIHASPFMRQNMEMEKSGIWAPGDVIANLPLGVKGPERVLCFYVAAGSGALCHRD